MLMIHRQTFYEKDGTPHEVTLQFVTRRVYEVRVDDEIYAIVESRSQGLEEIEDLLKQTKWSPIKPF